MAMYRGLSTFITDIRNCKTRDAEVQRVDKELANVRKAFTSGKMAAYDRKKYVWKLVYINMLGYDIDFGHMEMIALVSAPTYSEKLVGYLSTAVMLRNTDEQITLVVQAIKNDLQSTQDPIQCLALCGIANIGGKELAETVAGDVQRILFSRSIFPVVRKKAALCLLRLARISRDLLPPEEHAKRLIALLEDKNIGVVLSVTTLLAGLAERDPAAYEGCIGFLLVWLTRLAVQRQVTEDYMYHGTACPWLQVRMLRLLQVFPIPPTEALRVRLNEVVSHILSKTEVTKSVNRNNAEHCVLFEAISLLVKQGEASDLALRAKAVALLSKFINIREPNIRYLGLNSMASLVGLEGTTEAIRKQQATIFFSLKDADISIRRRALDLLFAMTDTSIAESVVNEMLTHLALADFAIRDEMVLKIAILAERFAPNLQWYVDTVLRLIALAGDHVSDDIWHRVVQIVTNHGDLQKYAASRLYRALEPLSAHETAVKVGGYILGEFGYFLADGDLDGGPPVSGIAQFAALHQQFPRVGAATKALLLSTYAKLGHLYPEELGPQVQPIFEAFTGALDADLQQRAVEYARFGASLSEATSAAVLDAMPAFPENRPSQLESRMAKAAAGGQDRDVWGDGEGAAAREAGERAPDDEGGDEAPSRAAAGVGGLAAPSAAAAAAAAAAPESDDLLGLGGMGSAPAPAPPAPAPAAVAGGVDPLSVPVTTRVGIADAAATATLLAALLLKPAGVLYEDEHVQVGVKKAIAGAEGRVSLFIGNKRPVPLVGFKLRVPPVPQLKATVAAGGGGADAAAEGGAGAVPTTIAPRQQLQVTVALECLQPFAEAPALQISFISAPGTGHAYALRLPVSVHAFCEPAAMPPADFKARWTALAGAPREVTAVIAPASGPGAVTMAAAGEALGRLGFSAIDAGAPGATGASSFRTRSTAPNGQLISVGCLAMAIPDAAGVGAFKVAVRTQHGDVSTALMGQVRAILEAL